MKYLFFCDRCHLKYQPLGEILVQDRDQIVEFMKIDYPGLPNKIAWKKFKKNIGGTIRQAICENCCKELNKKIFDLRYPKIYEQF